MKIDRESDDEDLVTLYNDLCNYAMETGTLNLISREQFMECLLLDFGNDISPKKVNQIYSSFDIYLTDCVDIRILISCLRCLRNPTETINDKLKAIFDFFDINRAGYIIEDDLYDISTLLCITDIEREVMEKLTQNTFQHKLCNNEEGVVIYYDDFCVYIFINYFYIVV